LEWAGLLWWAEREAGGPVGKKENLFFYYFSTKTAQNPISE
jgi:hypothetical protein